MTDREPVDLDLDLDDDLEAEALPGEADDEPTPRRPALLQPAALAIAAAVVALASFLSIDSLLYAIAAHSSDLGSRVNADVAKGVAAAHLGLGAIALLFGLMAAYLWDDDEPGWVRSLAWAAVLAATVGVLLQAVALGVALDAPTPPPSGVTG